MYNWDGGPPKPSSKLLDQCVQILLTDEDIERKNKTVPWRVRHWAIQNCKSFVYMEEQEVSDVSYEWDYIYAFYFGNEKDANWFELKWK